MANTMNLNKTGSSCSLPRHMVFRPQAAGSEFVRVKPSEAANGRRQAEEQARP